MDIIPSAKEVITRNNYNRFIYELGATSTLEFLSEILSQGITINNLIRSIRFVYAFGAVDVLFHLLLNTVVTVRVG